MDIKKTIKNTLLAVILLTISGIYAHAGFGVSPSDINSQYLKPGSQFEQTFTISRSGSLEEMTITIEPELSEMESWFTYIPSKSFSFERGVSTKEFTISVKVPSDAAYQNYSGVIRVFAVPTDQAVAGVSITQGVRLDAQLIVTETDFTSLLIRAITSEDTHKRDNVKIDILAENTGNTIASPTVKIKIMNLLMETVEELTVNDIGSVSPNETETLTATFSTQVPPGEYFVEVTVLLDGQELRTERLVMNIEDAPVVQEPEPEEEVSFFTQVGSIFRSFFTDVGDSWPYILMSALVFTIIYLILGKLWSKKGITKTTKKKLWAVLLGSQKISRVFLSIFVSISTLLIPISITTFSHTSTKEGSFKDTLLSISEGFKQTWPYTLIAIMMFVIAYLLLEKLWEGKGRTKKAKSWWGIVLGSKKLSRLGFSFFLSLTILLLLILYPLTKEQYKEPEILDIYGQTQGVADTSIAGGVLLYVLPGQQESKYIIYAQPDTTSRVIYEAQDGEEFSVVEETEGWFKVEIDLTTTGWLNKTAVKDVTKEEI
jgi:hypothetical protein